MVGLMLAALVAALATDEPQASAVEATPAPASTEPLREIGHVRARTAFCSAFETHFNAAVRPILASDERIGAIGFTLGTIESHYRARGGELLVYDDRVRLMAYVADLQKFVPQARRELAGLRASAALARDPEEAARTLETEAALAKALDKQRQIAIDSLGVVQAMMDLALGTNDNEVHPVVARSLRELGTIDTLAHLDGIRDARGLRASTAVQANVPGGYDAYTAATPANARDVRAYLQYDRQSDRIGDAEHRAAAAANIVANRCE